MNTREIKFRVWHEKPQEEMYYIELEKYLGSTGIVDPYVGNKEGIWMQYTGLRDKNNKEIYEGDICFTESKEYAMNKQVIWNDRLACFEFDYPLGKSILQSDDIEVIGNIYETPHLIKNQTA